MPTQGSWRVEQFEDLLVHTVPEMILDEDISSSVTAHYAEVPSGTCCACAARALNA
jgi:hypothetical protein